MLSAWKGEARVHAYVGLLVLLCGLIVLLGPAALRAHAQNPPPQEPGVTQRVFQLPRAPSEICTIKAAQTPNVDVLKPTIDWSGDGAFGGLTENFVVQAIANLTVPTAGTYTFRLSSDDGSELLIDDKLVIDHDGLHGESDKDGAVELTAGMHALRVNYFEAGGDNVLRLSWKRPGDSSFSVVPNSVLSTDAGVVRVTAPGNKECEGDVDSPGDGLPLEGVNPAYDLVNLRPAGFEPKVTGLEWDGDDLLVLTWGDDDGDPSSVTSAGEVWRLKGVKDADGPEDVTRTKIAEGLREPMGIKVVEGDIYISEKHQLSKLIDANSDGTYEAKDRVATWPFDGNFHEFAFGLLYKDGFFYLNLSVSIDLGGATTVPQGSNDRGTHLKINKDTGAVEYVAGGLRTPHGIGWGPDDSIFVTDNQGGWLPANKLIQIKPGKFYNHYTTGPDGPGRFDDQKPTPPAVWLPQNEIANSPSQPMLIPSGPFAGQMWIGDVTYGGIQRAFLEKVEGEYQGAVFRMTQGLESGITHMALQEDGSIIVGGLGAGGNWGQNGKLQFGLQKLVPNGTETFDIQKMELVDGGFDLTYTKPLSDETVADLATKYRVRQWGYAPTSAYGGPKIGEEELTVTGATLSDDRKTVTLAIDGLKPGRVVYVRSPRPFEAEGGEPLLSTEAWYTINKLPGYVAPADGLYELEDGRLSGGAKFDTEHAGYSGTGFVSGFGEVGASVAVDVNAPKAGDYMLALRYANGPNPFEGPKTMSLIVNGTSRQITLPSTGAWPNYQFYVDDVELEAGANTVELKYAAGDDGNVNLDALRVATADTQRLEAEDAELAGGANAQTEHAGYRGTGYVGGYQNQGASTTFEVTALADAVTEFTLGYANGPNPAPGTKEVSLYVNDQFAKKLALPSTGEWNVYGTYSNTVALRAGINEISIRYDAGDDGNVNLDYLDVEQNEPVQCEPATDPNDEFDGEALNRCRWTTVLNEEASGYSLADGKLQIKAQAGDITGTAISARNVLLQRAPTDGSWSATTKLSIDGDDDYVQGGVVAQASNTNWAKLVVMQKQGASDEWVIELARASGWQNSETLPAGAQDGITLQMFAVDGRLRGRYSLDDGATWTEVGNGFPLTGLATPGIGVAAYNGTGSEVATFERFAVGEPPELPPPPPCEEPYTPEAGYTMLFDGTDESLEDWTYAGGGSFVREDCAIKSVGAFGLLYTTQDYEAPYSLKLEWMMPGDDNSGVFVGFPDTGANTDQTAITQGEEIQIDPTDNPAQTTGAIYLEQAADAAARDAALNPPGEWNDYEIVVREDRIVVYLNGTKINEWIEDDPNVDLATGRIGLQTHGADDDVYFRNVRIKDLTEPVLRDSTTTATADPAEVTVGSGTDVTVKVSAEGAAPTGDVELKSGDAVLGSGTLVDGEVTIPTGAFDSPGTRTLTAAYAGDATTKPSTGTVEITVVEPALRDSTTTATADPAQVEVGSGSNVTVTVSAEGAVPTGDVQLKSGDVVLGSGALVDGKITIATGAFDSPGTKTLTAAYAGDATTKPSTGTVEITVKPKGGNPGGGNPGGGNPGGGNPGGGNPGGGNPGGGNPGVKPRGDQPGSKPGLAIRGGKADADRRRRNAAIRVRCSRSADACEGAVRLRVGKRTVGKGRFTIAAGANGTIRIKLNRKARELLAERKRATATLAITYGDGRTDRVSLRLTR